MKRSCHGETKTLQGSKNAPACPDGPTNASTPPRKRRASSFIRTVTVGSGIEPDLLTRDPLLKKEGRGARGLAACAAYRR
jgi:hypothetical protein